VEEKTKTKVEVRDGSPDPGHPKGREQATMGWEIPFGDVLTGGSENAASLPSIKQKGKTKAPKTNGLKGGKKKTGPGALTKDGSDRAGDIETKPPSGSRERRRIRGIGEQGSSS